MPFNNERLWLMEESALQNFLRSDLSRDKAQAASASEAGTNPYAYEGNIAVVRIAGALNQEFHWPPFCSSYSALRAQIEAAEKDPRVRAILLDIESPGGTVAGCEDLAATICEATKPVYAYTAGCACSAAYWLASASRSIGATATANVGSVGVLLVHLDYSGAYSEAGIQPTIFRSGEFKALGNQLESLSEKARTSLQQHVDQACAIFMDAVCAGRKQLKISDKETWAEGRVFHGEDAAKVGLIDCVCSRSQFISRIHKEVSMDAKELRTSYPEAVSAIESEAKAETASLVAEAENKVRGDASALAGVLFGDAAKEKMAAALDAGLSAEQAEKLGLSYSPEGAGATMEREMLRAIQNTDQPGPIPGKAQGEQNPLLAAAKRKYGKGA